MGGKFEHRSIVRPHDSHIGFSSPTVRACLTHPEGLPNPSLLNTTIVDAVFDPHRRTPLTTKITRDTSLKTVPWAVIRSDGQDGSGAELSPLSWPWEWNKLVPPRRIELLRGGTHLHGRQALLVDIDAGGGKEEGCPSG